MNDFSLHQAAKDGDLERAKQLIAGGAAVDSRDDEGRSPLHWAAEKGHYEVAELLISSKGDLNLKDHRGRTPVLVAAGNAKKTIVDLLLQHGAQGNCADDEGWTLLHHASERGWTDHVRRMLERGEADPNAATRTGTTPLMWAAVFGHEEVAALLIGAGADVHRRNAGKRTALHKSAGWGRTRVVQVLLEVEGLDLNPQGEDGDTPLHEACREGRLEVVKQLLEAGADTTLKNNEGKTALSVGIRKGAVEEIRLFVQHGAFFEDSEYARIFDMPVLKESVLKDVNICTQSIVNRYNRQSLPALYSISPFARRLPPNKKSLNLSDAQTRTVANFVEAEIGAKTFCNVVEARPMVLKMLCVRSLLTRQA